MNNNQTVNADNLPNSQILTILSVFATKKYFLVVFKKIFPSETVRIGRIR